MNEMTDEQREAEIRASHAYHDGSHASRIYSPTTDLLLRLLDAERARADAAEAKLAAIQPTPTPPHWPTRAATDPDGTVQWTGPTPLIASQPTRAITETHAVWLCPNGTTLSIERSLLDPNDPAYTRPRIDDTSLG